MLIFDAIFKKSDATAPFAPPTSKRENPFMAPAQTQDFQSDLLKAVNSVMAFFNVPKIKSTDLIWANNGVSVTIKFPDNDNSGWNSIGEIRGHFVSKVNDELEKLKSDYRIKSTFGDGISNLFNGKGNYSYTYYKL